MENQASQLANMPTSIKDIDCPRGILNPGLYFGFIKGYEAAVRDHKSVSVKSKLLGSYSLFIDICCFISMILP